MTSNQSAIIIGASSGIGRELAISLSQAGYRLGLTARRIDLLETLQASLTTTAYICQIDISDALAASTSLTTLITQLDDVDLIVISAGVGHLNPDLDIALELETISTNVAGFTAMADTAFRHFQTRGCGQLLAISSIAAIRGSAEAPAYNASKAYIANYLEGLRVKAAKLRLPITVTEIQPGFVATDMAKGDGLFWVASAKQAAAQIFQTIKRRRTHAYVTRRWRLIAWLLKILPGFLYQRLS